MATITPLIYFFGFGAVAVMVDARLLIGAAFQLFALLAIAVVPGWMFEIIGVTGLLSASTTWKWPEPSVGSAPVEHDRGR